MLIISTVAGAAATLWGLFGKSRDSTVSYLIGDRDRLGARVEQVEKAHEETRARLDKVEAELETLRLDHKTLLDFLRDICSGRFDGEWIRGRAADLLERFGGGKS